MARYRFFGCEMSEPESSGAGHPKRLLVSRRCAPARRLPVRVHRKAAPESSKPDLGERSAAGFVDRASPFGPILESAEIVDLRIPHFLQHLAT